MKPIPGYDGYLINEAGEVFSMKRGGLLKINGGTGARGYRHVLLYHGGQRFVCAIHKLVAVTFIGDSKGLQVNHKNGDKLDNRLENLEYATPKQNTRHAMECGLRPGGKLSELDIWSIQASRASSVKLAKTFGVNASYVRRIKVGAVQ